MPAPTLDPEALKERLDPVSYHVTQEAGTESPGTGRWLYNKETGIYHCIVCDAPLYHSNDKYDSGTGWPSFTRPVSDDAVVERKDTSHGMVRTEIACASCGAHLGHLFDDGPEPTGERHCTNSAAFGFRKEE